MRPVSAVARSGLDHMLHRRRLRKFGRASSLLALTLPSHTIDYRELLRQRRHDPTLFGDGRAITVVARRRAPSDASAS